MSKDNNERKPRGGRGHGPGGGMKVVDKPKNFKKTFSKLLKYLKPYKVKLVLVIIFAIGSAAFAILGPKILGNATTEIFEGLIAKMSGIVGGGIDFGYIGNIMKLLLGLYMASALFSYIQGFIVTGIAQDEIGRAHV